MCHYTLHIHSCGDSYFTKYSSCSFDRAAHHPASMLNPLHPLARPAIPAFQTFPPPPQAPFTTTSASSSSESSSTISSGSSSAGTMQGSPPSSQIAPQPSGGNASQATAGPAYGTGTALPTLPYPQTYIKGEASKCYVFEVVLQRREGGDCPSCARSPRRRRLPARARGCFAVS